MKDRNQETIICDGKNKGIKSTWSREVAVDATKSHDFMVSSFDFTM